MSVSIFVVTVLTYYHSDMQSVIPSCLRRPMVPSDSFGTKLSNAHKHFQFVLSLLEGLHVPRGAFSYLGAFSYSGGAFSYLGALLVIWGHFQLLGQNQLFRGEISYLEGRFQLFGGRFQLFGETLANLLISITE